MRRRISERERERHREGKNGGGGKGRREREREKDKGELEIKKEKDKKKRGKKQVGRHWTRIIELKGKIYIYEEWSEITKTDIHAGGREGGKGRGQRSERKRM